MLDHHFTGIGKVGHLSEIALKIKSIYNNHLTYIAIYRYTSLILDPIIMIIRGFQEFVDNSLDSELFLYLANL